MHPMLNVAMIAAREAGEIITRYFGEIDRLTIEEKTKNNFVSEVDKLAEQAIIRTIRKYYPQHSILAEESGEQAQKSDIQWIIDPLDGTTNFLHKFPHFSVSIAILEKKRLTHGVVFDPIRDEMFHASRGEGARLNNRRLRVSEENNLEKALLATGFPYYEFDYIDSYLASFKAFMTTTAGIRRPGSAALDLAYVAAGRVDGYWEFNLQPWDIAAGILLVQEAGGLCTDFAGGDNQLKSGNVLACTPKLMKPMAKILSQTIAAEYKK